jgi:hypothetical protein
MGNSEKTVGNYGKLNYVSWCPAAAAGLINHRPSTIQTMKHTALLLLAVAAASLTLSACQTKEAPAPAPAPMPMGGYSSGK